MKGSKTTVRFGRLRTSPLPGLAETIGLPETQYCHLLPVPPPQTWGIGYIVDRGSLTWVVNFPLLGHLVSFIVMSISWVWSGGQETWALVEHYCASGGGACNPSAGLRGFQRSPQGMHVQNVGPPESRPTTCQPMDLLGSEMELFWQKGSALAQCGDTALLHLGHMISLHWAPGKHDCSWLN